MSQEMTGATILANVRALLPEINDRAVEIEEKRSVPRDIVEKLRTAGVFRRYVPRSHGGAELWPDEAATVIEAIASADASTAWISAVASEGAGFYAYLPSDTYDKIYAGGPDVIHAGVINQTGTVVRDGDGYRFSGRWKFASGSATADYICVNGRLEGAEPPAPGHPPASRFGILPAAEVNIEETWRVGGLKGTGSNDVVVDGLYVPAEWTGTFAEPPTLARYPLDKVGLAGRFGIDMAAVAIGIAQGALDDITKIALEKVPATATDKLAADPVTQYTLGALATDLFMARTLVHEVARDDQASVSDGGSPSMDAMMARKARLARAAAVAADVVEGCYRLSGTTGLFESCPLQRRLRDIGGVTQHFTLSVRTAFGPVGGSLLRASAG